MSFVDNVVEGILGPEEDRGTNAFSAVGGVLAKPGEFFDRSLSMASLFGVAGDAYDFRVGLTGRNSQGESVAGWERWSSLLGIGVLGATVGGGAMMLRAGKPPSELLMNGMSRIQKLQDANARLLQGDRGALQIGKVPDSTTIGGGVNRVLADTAGVPNEDLARLTHGNGLEDPSTVFMTTSQKTNDILRLDAQGADVVSDVDGYVHLARNIGGASNENMVGYLKNLGQVLREKVPSFAAQAGRINNGEKVNGDPALMAAAWTAARWQWAIDNPDFKFLGTVAEDAQREWTKLVTGSDELIDMDVVTTSMVDFMAATEWVTHPELAINPLVRIESINLDAATPAMALSVLEFEPIRLDQMTGVEASNRLKALFAHHPSAMVGFLADNLRGLMDQALRKPQKVNWDNWWTDLKHMPEGIENADPAEAVGSWRKWYPKARHDLVKESQKLFVEQRGNKSVSKHFADEDGSTRWLISVASILSAGEDWGTNVAKSVDIATAMRKNPKATLGKLGKILQKSKARGGYGMKISADDLVKIKLLDGVDDPLDYFRTGTMKVSEQLSLKQISHRLQRGGDVSDLLSRRKRPPDWESLKQDSFAYAIYNARDADLDDRAEYMARLMAGEDGWGPMSGTLEGGAGENVRRSLPVVADRQHYKASLGFSIIPSTWYSSQRHAYDQFAQAARIVAAQMGEVEQTIYRKGSQSFRLAEDAEEAFGANYARFAVTEKMPVLPEEVQAITWMRYRAMSHHTDPLGRDWPEGFKTPDGMGKNEALGQTAGFKDVAVGGTAGWREGGGPDLAFSNSVLKWITGEASQNLPSNITTAGHGIDTKRYLSAPEDLGLPVQGEVKHVRQSLTLEPTPDGTWHITSEGPSPRRGLYATRAQHNGKSVLRPNKPRRVKSAPDELERIRNASRSVEDPGRHGASGSKEFGAGVDHPGLEPGPKALITSQQDGWGDFGGSPGESHRRVMQVWEAGGVSVTARELPPSKGGSTIWLKVVDEKDPSKNIGPFWKSEDAEKAFGKKFQDYAKTDTEPRQGWTYDFKTVADLELARRLINEDASTLPAAMGAKGFMAKMFPGKAYKVPKGDMYMTQRAKRRYNDRAKRIAKWYDEQPVWNDNALPAYEAMGRQTKAQWLYLTEEMGVEVEFVVIDYNKPAHLIRDPYPDTKSMIADVRDNNHLLISKTPEGDHPYFTIDPDTGVHENDMFRAVHDFFGHNVHENGFDRFGEDIAFLTHSQMYGDDALPALAMETRAQNSWLTDRNPEGSLSPTFPEQKFGILPKEFRNDVRDSRYWAVESMPTHADKIFKEQVLDITWYGNADSDMPKDLIGVWEHHFLDDAGMQMSVLDPGGQAQVSNAVRAYVEPGSNGLGGYVSPNRSGRFDAGGVGDHRYSDDMAVFDNKVTVINPDGAKAGRFAKKGKETKAAEFGSPFDVTVNGEAVTEIGFALNPDGMPFMGFGADGVAQLKAQFGPSVARVTQGRTTITNLNSKRVGKGAFLVELPPTRGKIDALTFDEVAELLVDISGNPANGRVVVPKALEAAKQTKPKPEVEL